MNLPQETLGFRRASFSLASRYSYRHSLSCTVHHSFRYGFSRCTMLLYRSRVFTLYSRSGVFCLNASGGFLQPCAPASAFASAFARRLESAKMSANIPPSPNYSVNTRKPEASVACFSPGHLRRTITRPVSYYALFKCVAASEPTSWLSVQFHILLHLT